MTYTLAAKIFWSLCAPGNLIGILGALGLLAAVLRWRPLAVRLIGLCLVLLVAFGLTPLGQILLHPLENRFRVADPTAIARARGIIVLAGSENPDLTENRSQAVVGDAATRLMAGIELAQRFPAKTLLFTGGMPNARGITQADVAAMVFDVMAVNPAQVVYEKQSMNTYDSAIATRALVAPKRGEPWVLVTSAYHMPRSVAVFEAAGWTIVPYPVDYRTRERGVTWTIHVAKRLREADLAVHEWIGLAVYRLMGRTAELYPDNGDDD